MILNRKSIALCSHGAVRRSDRCSYRPMGRPGRAAPNAANAPEGRGYRAGFTLAELLVSMGVLALLVFLFTQLLTSAATITILGHKRIDADSEARQVLDRMAIDFAQMVKRTDVDSYVKVLGTQQNQNDQIAFYCAVPGYYPATGAQSPLSLVAYRVNSNPASSSYNKLERLAKGLVWNGASGGATPTPVPMVFLPLTIATTWPAACYPLCNSDPVYSTDPAYEVIGPDVFRFEYYYKLTAGLITDCGPNCGHSWRDVAAIVVAIAVIDPKSRVLFTDQDIATLNTGPACNTCNFLPDWVSGDAQSGTLLTAWQNKLNQITTLRRQALPGVRVYERYFYLNQ